MANSYFPVEVKKTPQNNDVIPEYAHWGFGRLPNLAVSTQFTKAVVQAAIDSNALLGRTFGGALITESGQELEVYGIRLSASVRSRFYIVTNEDDDVTGSPRIINVDSIYAGGIDGVVYLDYYWPLKCNQYITIRVNDYDRVALANDSDLLYVGAQWYARAKTYYKPTGDEKWAANIKGTSLVFGTGPTHTAYMYHVLLLNLIRVAGGSIAPNLNGWPGFNTQHVINFSTSGYFDFNKQQLSIYEYATNDAAQNITPSVFEANLKAMVERDLFNPEYPNNAVLLMSPPPMANTADNNKLITLRTNINNIYTYYKGLLSTQNRIFLINYESGFDRNDANNYIDSAGNGVHPSNLGASRLNTAVNIPFMASDDGIALISYLKTA